MTAGPLAGYRVLVTRPLLQADELAGAIESAGGTAVRFPVIVIEPRSPAEIRTDFAALPDPDILVFVSSNAVECGLPTVAQSGARIAVVGPATRAAVERAGSSVDIFPDGGFDSEHLLRHRAFDDISGRAVTIVRGFSGRDLLGTELGRRGARVSYLPVYARHTAVPAAGALRRLEDDLCNGAIDCVTVMSVETLDKLLELLSADAVECLRRCRLVAPGDRVIKTALDRVPGIAATMAHGPAAADMVRALVTSRRSEQDR